MISQREKDQIYEPSMCSNVQQPSAMVGVLVGANVGG